MTHYADIYDHMYTVIQVGFLILFPAIMLYLESRYRFVKAVSPIVICYAVGIILANLPFVRIDRLLFTQVSEVSVGLAIPLLLFNSNFSEWISHSGKSILSYVLSVLAVIISSVLFFQVFKNAIPDAWKISGMLVGVYTGGTPNMSAIGMAFGTPQEIYILLNSSDVILGSIYFILIITLMKRFLGLFLPKYTQIQKNTNEKEMDSKPKISTKQFVINIIIVLILGIIILGLAVWISISIKGDLADPILILVLTTCGIGASFIKKIQKMKGSYETAFYLLLIFSLSLGGLADINELLNKSTDLFVYTACVMFTAIIIHYMLAAIFRIDRDTVIITSTAGIYGPAFIGPVANVIRNRELIFPGIAMGLLGYAIGNYLGIGIGMLLK